MIYTIIATNAKGDSVELDLANPWAGGIAVVGASGLGPAMVRSIRSTSRRRTEPSSIHRGSSLETSSYTSSS